MSKLAVTVATLCTLAIPLAAQRARTFVDVPVVGAEVPATADDNGSSTFAFRGAPRCGPDGTIVLVAVSPDGATSSRVVLIDRTGHRSVVGFATAFREVTPDLQVVATAVRQAGELYALVDLGDTTRPMARKVLSISAATGALWVRDIDESRIHVKDIAALPSGDVLLVGVQPLDTVAVTAILRRDGVQSAVRPLPGPRPPGALAAVANEAGAFVVDDMNDRVVQVSSDNSNVREFALARPSPDARLIGAQLAGEELATLHADVTAQGQGVRRFVSVQDTSIGELRRTLGPFDEMVVCYAAPDQRHEVTLLSVTKSGWVLRRGTW